MTADPEMRNINPESVNIDNYRKLVQTYINMHVYNAALFWADKIVALTAGNPRDVYWLAQCMYLLKQYHRAAHLLKLKNLDKTYILCNILAVRCYLEANEYNEALKVLNAMDIEVLLQNNSALEAAMFDETPKNQIKSSVLLIKGKVLEAMDNRGLASECYKQALINDVYCYEAFESLIQHNMLTAAEEEDLLFSLPVSHQCSAEETEVLLFLYKSKLKKYHSCTKSDIFQNNFNTELVNIVGNLNKGNVSTNDEMVVENKENPVLQRLCHSLDVIISEAERLYYNCNYVLCTLITEYVLKQDPYHSGCLPLHISCQVELKQSNKLFTLAHNLVDLYPNMAISWFAVGCYYYVINKSDSARRFLAKAASLDRLFGPAWLAYGHSFAVDNEHDQAMAAYFKASQLMRGCHLPLMYIGLECGLTNNVRLAEKFFQQAIKIAPNDPYVIHEMGVIAFQNLDYIGAEKHFKNALSIVKARKETFVPKQWAPLISNLGHTLRKLKRYEEALKYHQEALLLYPQSSNIFSSIAYVYALMGYLEEAVNWFHKALGLKRDDIFSTTMLNYVIEQLSEDQLPFPGAPEEIPDFHIEVKNDDSTIQDAQTESLAFEEKDSVTNDMSMSMEMDISNLNESMKN